jgi:hydrogenase nickel incorporation protein HypA/HybF
VADPRIVSMHELVITQNLLDTVLAEARKAEAREVTGVHLVVGELSGIASDCVQFYFDILKKDTVASRATIDFTPVPALFRCRDCHTEFHSGGETVWICPDCTGCSIEILNGRDCNIESIEVEQ